VKLVSKMPCRVEHCIQIMEALAPASYRLDWDNIGLHLGHPKSEVHRILVTLTITDAVVYKAVNERVNLIISHHPLIFKPLKTIRTDLPGGRVIKMLLNNDIAVFCSHTNLDRAPQGLNYWLAEDLQLKNHKVLAADITNPDVGLGRIGEISPIALQDLVSRLNSRWHTKVRYVGAPDHKCEKVAVCGGSGGDLIYQAWYNHADVLITGDISYHDALDASALGIAVIDAGHFTTEKIMVEKVAAYLESKLPNVQIIQGIDGDNPFMY